LSELTFQLAMRITFLAPKRYSRPASRFINRRRDAGLNLGLDHDFDLPFLIGEHERGLLGADG
jgi:hypothetical protein